MTKLNIQKKRQNWTNKTKAETKIIFKLLNKIYDFTLSRKKIYLGSSCQTISNVEMVIRKINKFI